MQFSSQTLDSDAALSQTPGAVICVAHPNIALVKYWGKKAGPNNAPAVGSLSITLDTLQTRTCVAFVPDLAADTFLLNSEVVDALQYDRLTRFLDRIRHMAQTDVRAAVRSTNNFPTGAGLASSASGFAALALAASRAAGLALDDTSLSRLARTGSGSAARSVFGGYVELACGTAEDGHDAVATPLWPPDYWPLRVIVVITDSSKKTVGSTEGMLRTQKTSPSYSAWIEQQQDDLKSARRAIAQRDFQALAEVSEHSCLKMHALMGSATPPLCYFNAGTRAAIDKVRQLREAGRNVFFTIDAGPQLKAVCLPCDAAFVHDALSQTAGVQSVLHVGLGPGARCVGLDKGL